MLFILFPLDLINQEENYYFIEKISNNMLVFV